MWVVIAAILVLFMQAGFMFLEVGFVRAKNAGTIVAKILTNLSIAAICYWAVGFAFAFGSGDVFGDNSTLASIIGSNGFFLQVAGTGGVDDLAGNSGIPVMSVSAASIDAKFLFQFAFCAVSLAIVWGSTLERIKYGAYVIYAIIFSAIIYPIGSHWVFGGGWLQNGDTFLLPTGMQDFAGSTAVHLIGATGALAALLLLGPRKGKYGSDGKPRVIPGHSMPLVGLGVLILFVGWFGFNAGSTLGTADGRLADVAVITMLGAAGGVLGAFTVSMLRLKTIDIGMVGNGMIAGLVGITAPSGYVEVWAAPIIGMVGRCDRRVRRDPDRQEDRRPDRCHLGARPGRHLGHDRVRVLHVTAPGPVQRVRQPRRRTALRRWPGPADRAGHGRVDRLHVRVRPELRHVLHHQEDDRATRDRGGRGRRPRHRRARHVRIPRAVHPAARDRCLVDRSGGSARRCPGARGAPGPRRRSTRGGDSMKKVEAFVRHEAFEPIRMELLDKGFPSLSIAEYKGSGRQKGITERYRGSELTIHLRPKLKLEIVVDDTDVGVITETILKHARTGQVGDGKIFVIPVEAAIRIRTGEDGGEVLQAHETEEIPAGA